MGWQYAWGIQSFIPRLICLPVTFDWKFLVLTLAESRSLNIYNPPSNSFAIEAFNFLSAFSNIVLCGDFNSHHGMWWSNLSNSNGRNLVGVIERFDDVILNTSIPKGADRGGWRGLSPPLPIRILMFIFLVFHQHCTVSRYRVHCKMFFGSTTGVATHSLSNQEVMNFRALRNIEAAFFILACFALPYIIRAGCCRALPVWKQA